ncbi:MAG: DoxX family membrane protein [Moraxellaceae bacterium]|nr:DoxX family membrane protein [Pseudobdellovibrionaceae bacterium]
MIARILLGLIFFVFGLNGFLNFLPTPPMPDGAGAFAGALAATGYMFPLIKLIEVTVGILLLANRFVALALLLLAPITVNILLFHAVLAPTGLPLPIVILVLHLYLARVHASAYKPILTA